MRGLIRRWLARLAGCTPEQIRARQHDTYWWTGEYHDLDEVAREFGVDLDEEEKP